MATAAMQRSLITALALSAATVALAAQRRITTHPAEPYLKQLFPSAAAFSGHEGTPLHWKGSRRSREASAGSAHGACVLEH